MQPCKHCCQSITLLAHLMSKNRNSTYIHTYTHSGDQFFYFYTLYYNNFYNAFFYFFFKKIIFDRFNFYITMICCVNMKVFRYETIGIIFQSDKVNAL